MPNWSNTPPVTGKVINLKLIRTPAAKTLRLICTSSRIVGCYTHFWHGRTQPCDGPDLCEIDRQGIPAVWHMYIATIDPTTREQFIFEGTANAAEAFQKYFDTYGSLRGCCFHASRNGHAANGRVNITTFPADQSKTALPKEPDVPAVLSMIWRIEKPERQQVGCEPGTDDLIRNPETTANQILTLQQRAKHDRPA